jgi:hypothetical protein
MLIMMRFSILKDHISAQLTQPESEAGMIWKENYKVGFEHLKLLKRDFHLCLFHLQEYRR